MNRQNPLDALMKKFSTELKYKVPLGLIPEEEEREFKYEGIETAIVLYWSYKRDLLNDNIDKLVNTFFKIDKKLMHSILLRMMKDTIGNVLESYMYNAKGKEFVVDYIAFTSQWQYQFYKDLDMMYPHIKSFSELPQTQEAYDAIFQLLDKRYAEYHHIETNTSKTKEPTTETPKGDNIIPDDFFLKG